MQPPAAQKQTGSLLHPAHHPVLGRKSTHRKKDGLRSRPVDQLIELLSLGLAAQTRLRRKVALTHQTLPDKPQWTGDATSMQGQAGTCWVERCVGRIVCRGNPLAGGVGSPLQLAPQSTGHSRARRKENWSAQWTTWRLLLAHPSASCLDLILCSVFLSFLRSAGGPRLGEAMRDG